MTSDNWVSSHVLFSHLFIFFGNIPVVLFCLFLTGYIILSWLSCKRPYCILDMSLAPFWSTISLTCSHFSPSWITSSVGNQMPWNEVAQAGYGGIHESAKGGLQLTTSEDQGLPTTKGVILEVDSLTHRWQTQGPQAESGPSPCFIRPRALFLSSCSTELLLNC